nr:venom protein [Lampona murina]
MSKTQAFGLLGFFLVHAIFAAVIVPEELVAEMETGRDKYCGTTGSLCEDDPCCEGYTCRFTGRTGRLFMCF